jgi:hypothetical protein
MHILKKHAIHKDLHIVDPIQLLACFSPGFPMRQTLENACNNQSAPLFDLRAIIPGDFLASTIVLQKPIRVSEPTDSTHRTIQHATLGATV